MIKTRRSFLNSILGFLLAGASGLTRAKPPLPGNDRLARTMERELRGIQPIESDEVTLQAPEIAEDGAIVPISVESTLPHVDSIWVFVEKNPNPLAARFRFDDSLDPFVSLRIKMNESCDVIAVVKSGESCLSARKRVRVLLGGCG